MRERNVWWALAISLGMCAYGGAAIVSQLSHPWGDSGERLGWLLAPLLIGLVGLVGLAFAIAWQPEEKPPLRFSPLFSFYAHGWRKLWKTEWLLWMYGIVAAVSVVGSALGAVFTRYYFHAELLSMEGNIPQADPKEWLFFAAWRSLPHWPGRALDRFFPSVSGRGLELVTLLVVVGLAIWAIPKILKLRGEPGRSDKVTFYVLSLVVLAIGCAAKVMVGISHIVRSPSGAYPITRAEGVANVGADIAVGTIMGAMLVGGAIGSLFRASRNEGVSRHSFLSDSVYYYERMAGLYLICLAPALLWEIPFLLNKTMPFYIGALVDPVIKLLLMFAPFAVVADDISVKAAILNSLHLWRKHFPFIISLVATGAFFVSLISAPSHILRAVLTMRSWIFTAWQPVHALLLTAASALILLAVWEFHQAIRNEPGAAEKQS